MIYKPILFLSWFTFLRQPQEHSGYHLVLSDHSQEHVDQLESAKPVLATPVNIVMNLWGVKELLMRADRLENEEKGKVKAKVGEKKRMENIWRQGSSHSLLKKVTHWFWVLHRLNCQYGSTLVFIAKTVGLAKTRRAAREHRPRPRPNALSRIVNQCELIGKWSGSTPTLNGFYLDPWYSFPPSFKKIRPVVFPVSCKQTQPLPKVA